MADSPAAQVDRLGRLRDRLHALQFEERALTELVREALKKRKGKPIAGERYEAELIPTSREVVEDLAGFRRAVGPRRFLECVRVELKAARELVGRELVARFARKRHGTPKVRVIQREPAKAPRRAPAAAAGVKR